MIEYTNPATGTTDWPSGHVCAVAVCDMAPCSGGSEPTRSHTTHDPDAGDVDGEEPCVCAGHDPHDPTGRACAIAGRVMTGEYDEAACGACIAAAIEEDAKRGRHYPPGHAVWRVLAAKSERRIR